MAEIGKPVREWEVAEPSIEPRKPIKREWDREEKKEKVKTPEREKVGV